MSTTAEWTVEEFCRFYRACPDRARVAIERFATIRDAWAGAEAEELIWAATQPGVLDDRNLRLFACWCVRQVWHLLKDDRIKQAIQIAERFAQGEATREQLAAARAAARAAAWAAARAAARDAAWDAARDAARDAAWDAAWAAAWDAAWDAARAAQARWLRENAKPNFYRPTMT